MAMNTIHMIIIAKASRRISCTARIIRLPIINTATVVLVLISNHNTAQGKLRCITLKITLA
jgi:hypothetical protein